MGSPRNTRRAAAAAAMLAGALALAAPAGMAAPSSETVLVKLDPAATRAERADVAGALDAVSGRGLLGGWRAYRLDDPVTLAQAKAALAGTTVDLGVQIDRPVRPLAAATDPSWGSQWDMTTIGAPEAWDLAPGVPVIVATTDTGVDISHPELAGRVWVNTGEIAANGLDDDHNGYVDDVNGWDFRNNDAGVFDGAAVDTHGTHVAGTIAASRDNGVGIAGLSSTARLMPVKFMEDASGGTFMNGVLAIQYAVDHGARVINASWGSSSYWQPMCDAVQAAVNRGVLFVAAAGNDGLDEGAGVAYPAACPSAGIVSVAATTGTDHLAAFSNRGATTVDLGAPGESIYSLAPGSGYSWKSGTSMAAPHVAGVAAMLLGRHPSLGVADLKSLLMDTGAPAAALAGTTVSGRRLSASAAMSAADAPDTTPPTAPVITSPAAGAVVNDATVTWTGSTDASGIDGYRVTVDGTVVGNVGSGVRSLDPGPLADGPHSVTVTAADTAGNTTAGTAVPFTLDTRPPAAFTMTAPAATAATEVTVTWTPSSDDNGIARYRVRWDGGAVTLGATATRLPFALPVGGGFEVTVAADDPAGNTTSVTATILPQPVPDRVVPDPPSVAPAPAPAKKPVYRLVRRCKKTVKRVRVGRVFVKRSVRTCTTVRVRVGVR